MRADFTAKLALAVDLAVLKGSGSGAEPLGVAAHPDVQGETGGLGE